MLNRSFVVFRQWGAEIKLLEVVVFNCVVFRQLGVEIKLLEVVVFN